MSSTLKKSQLVNDDDSAQKTDKANNNANTGSKRVFFILFLSLVTDLVAFSLMLPLLPTIMDHYDQHDTGGLYSAMKLQTQWLASLIGAPVSAQWNNVLFGGLIGSVISLLQFLTSPLLGAASDVWGRKPILLAAMVTTTISFGVWAVSGTFAVFFLARILNGIGKANINISSSIVTDVSTPQNRSHGMALMGIAFSIGFTFGPMIGAFFAHYAKSQGSAAYTTPLLLALCMSIVNIALVWLFLTETLPPAHRAKSVVSNELDALRLVNPKALFKFESVQDLNARDLSTVRAMGVANFASLLIYSGLEFNLTFLTHTRFNFSSMDQGKMFLSMGLIATVVQGGFVRRIRPDREISAVIKAVVLLVPAFVIIGLAESVTQFYIGFILFSIASSFIMPCLSAAISSIGPAHQKGSINGIFRSLGSLARGLGPLIASFVYWWCGPAVCYLSGALCLIVPLILLRRIDKTMKTE